MTADRDPRWGRASDWLAGEHDVEPVGRLAVLGAPVRLGSITPGRCDLAPGAVRAALHRYSTYDVEANVDLDRLAATDLGDLDVEEATPDEALEPIADGLRRSLEGAEAAVLLGGNNSITRPGCHGVGLEDVGLLTLDAHLDLRDLEGGLTNGNPVRALLADGLAGDRIVQIGIQAFANSAPYLNVAQEAGIHVITADAARARRVDTVVSHGLEHLAARAETIYVDLDLDVLDRVHAPAAPGSRPGGLTPTEVRLAAWVCGLHPKVRVLDLVEIDPMHDVADATALAAASFFLSFAAGLVARLSKGAIS